MILFALVIVMRAAFLLAVFLMGSCVGLGDINRDKLFGDWLYADAMQSCEYVFKEDGTFRGKVIYRGKVLSRFKGRWSVHKGALLYEYTGDALGKIPAGTKDQDTLLAVDNDHFLIRAADGSERRYVRSK